MSRKWYSNQRIIDDGRLVLNNLAWSNYSQIEKITALWCETNLFIQEFFTKIDPAFRFTVNSEDLFSDPKASIGMHTFLDNNFHLPESKAKTLIQRKVNAQPFHRKQILTDNDRQKIGAILANYDIEENKPFNTTVLS